MTDSIFAWALPASVGENDDATINWLKKPKPRRRIGLGAMDERRGILD